jgi:hypothetical protein
MTEKLLSNASRQVGVLRNEISSFTVQVVKDARTLAEDAASMRAEFEAKNRELERKLNELDKIFYYLNKYSA